MILENIEALSGGEGAINAKCPGEKIYSELDYHTHVSQRYYHDYYYFQDAIYVATEMMCFAGGSGTLAGSNAIYTIETVYDKHVPCEGRCGVWN